MGASFCGSSADLRALICLAVPTHASCSLCWVECLHEGVSKRGEQLLVWGADGALRKSCLVRYSAHTEYFLLCRSDGDVHTRLGLSPASYLR